MKARLPIETFDLPIQEIRRGYYSDVYFWRTKRILEKKGRNSKVLMQVFQRNKAVLCGTDEVRAVLQIGTGLYTKPEAAFNLFDNLIILKRRIRQAAGQGRNTGFSDQDFFNLLRERRELEQRLNDLWVNESDELEIKSLNDGDEISSWETVMTIEGPYTLFAHLETVYLGILARRTKVATNVKRVVDAARGKPILFFPARFDHYGAQTGDGYAAMVSGAIGVSTDAQAEWWGRKGIGTIPHALIAAFDGDTAEATLAFAEMYPELDTVSLVDFHNDCVTASLEVARAMRQKGRALWGVRLDTSGTMIDRSVVPQMGTFKPTGVCPQLVRNVRRALDFDGFTSVKVGVSGGFNAEKINEFEELGVPVDFYGVGSSLFEGNYDFTADIVKPCAKAGRRYNPNPRLSV